MRNIPECTLRLGIRMARIPGRSGIRRLISMWWDGSSTSGWMTSRSCGMGSFWWKRKAAHSKVSQVMVEESALVVLKKAYDAFNARDIDAALATMQPDVEWPNGM